MVNDMFRKAIKNTPEVEFVEWHGTLDGSKEVALLVGHERGLNPDGTHHVVLDKGGRFIILDNELQIETHKGMATVSIGDFVVKDGNGDIYVCSPIEFHKTYRII